MASEAGVAAAPDHTLKKYQVRAFRFPMPPTLDEQRQIVDVMKGSKAKFAALVNKQATLGELKNSLMHDLLTGRVRMRDIPKVAVA